MSKKSYRKLNLSRLTKADLISLIKRMDSMSPEANEECIEPGISFAEACFRSLIDEEVIKN